VPAVAAHYGASPDGLWSVPNPVLVLTLQGPRYSMPYFVNPKLNYVIQGPRKRWGPVTGFDMLSRTGGALTVLGCAWQSAGS